MNSRELVVRAIEFEGPERVPLWFTELSIFDAVEVPSSFVGGFPKTWKPLSGKSGYDEWGCFWTVPSKDGWSTMGMVTGHPLHSWSKLDEYEFPQLKLVADVESYRRSFPEKYLVGSVPFTLFERMHFLRGFTNLMLDFHMNRDKVSYLAERVASVQSELVRQWGELNVDGILFTDDWGSQQGLFTSPSIFRAIFKPRYRMLFDLAHKYNMHVFLHSDGRISEIIPDFIEVGVDVINLPQPRSLFGIDYLGKNFGGKICFLANVDNQTTLVKGSEDEIRMEALHLIRSLGCFNGGLIAGWIDPCDTLALKIPRERLLSAFDTLRG